jgi:2-polyprenyl-3-methyl-5-hydroxy-6-metoxy-1,4-benzoquinol methylase
VAISEDELRPPDLMRLKEPALAHDIAFLQRRRAQFVAVPCPGCGGREASPWGEKSGFRFTRCPACRTIWMNPRAPQELLHGFYRQSENYAFWNRHIFPASEPVRRERLFVPRAQRTVAACRRFGAGPGTLMDVGAAFGTFCDAVRAEGHFTRVVAVEPTPELAQTCRDRGIETYEEPVERLSLPPRSVDVITAFEVLEHLFSPEGFLRRCAAFLAPGGLLIATCPSGEGLGTLVIGARAKAVDHEHINLFNPESLARLFGACGLEVLEVATPGELDVELLMKAFAEDPSLAQGQGFFSHLFGAGREALRSAFQQFLRDNLLSSHLWIVGRAP